MITPKKLNWLTFFKLPAAWWCGVRVKTLSTACCKVGVRYGWRNQNPFKSMFWAVQGMAAELSTAGLVIDQIDKSKKNVAMLVVANTSTFNKKARGYITFSCNQGALVATSLEKAIATKTPQRITLHAIGRDAAGDIVSSFTFEWSIKLRD